MASPGFAAGHALDETRNQCISHRQRQQSSNEGYRIDHIDSQDALLGEKDTEEKVAATIPKIRGSGRTIPVILPNKSSGRRRGTNYAEEYPPDELGSQMGPNARVWRVYLDEADEYDAEMMESFRDTTDVLLVFAGLFSAVVSTFLSQASQALQPDYAQVTASLMTELVGLQRAIAAGTSVTDIPPSQLSFSNAGMTTTSLDHWVNGLWFASLSLSLVAALLAVLVKQWLQRYMSALSGTPRERVLVRHFRFMGLQTWKVPQITETLPVLLHMALFMFLVGLVMFVWALDLATASIIFVITTTCFLFYSLSNILASIYPSCSYKTPVSEAISYIWWPLRSVATFRLKRYDPNLAIVYRKLISLFGVIFSVSYTWLPVKTGKQVEKDIAVNEIDNVLFSALAWLVSASSDPSAGGVVVQSMAGLPFYIDEKHTRMVWGILFEESVTKSDPESLGPNLGVTLMGYAASNFRLTRPYCDAYNALYPTAPPTLKSLAALLPTNSPGLEAYFIANLDHLALPPWMWKSLFEKGIWYRNSDPLNLLIKLLCVMREARVVDITTGMYQVNKANWYLPSATRLVELCRWDSRIAKSVFQFACRHLLTDPSAVAIQSQLDNIKTGEYAFSQSPPTIVHLIHGILDQIQARIEIIGPIQDYLTAVEGGLLSVSTKHWLEPTFMDALHRCIIFKNRIPHHDPPTFVPLYHRQPVAASTTLLLLYILDISQHPWPLSRVPDITSPYAFKSLCYKVFSKQEEAVFEAFINNNGLATFRRCFPCQYKQTDYAADICSIVIPYVDYVTNLVHTEKDDQGQRHLSIISQPDNLAWLIWLSIAPGSPSFDEITGLTARNKLRQLLRSLSIERQMWVEAVEVLIEGLRRDSASFGHEMLTYAEVGDGFGALGLVGDEFRLCGYATKTVGYGPDFQRLMEPGNEESFNSAYGPFAVYYAPASSPKPRPVESWSKRVGAGLRRMKRRDLERGVLV